MARAKTNSHLTVQRDIETVAMLARTLSDANRLRILLCLGKGKKSVSRIVEELELSQPLVSHHLKELKRTLLVNVEREGPFIYYEIADGRVIRLLEEIAVISSDLLAKRTTF